MNAVNGVVQAGGRTPQPHDQASDLVHAIFEMGNGLLICTMPNGEKRTLYFRSLTDAEARKYGPRDREQL